MDELKTLEELFANDTTPAPFKTLFDEGYRIDLSNGFDIYTNLGYDVYRKTMEVRWQNENTNRTRRI